MREWSRKPENKLKQKERMKIYQKNIRIKYEEYKRTIRCSLCGIGGHPAIIDFHHNSGNGGRENSVARLVSASATWERIMKEISKCVPLCSNCHRKLHYEERHAPHN